MWNLTQISDTTFRYWQNSTVHKLTVGPNGAITSTEAIGETQHPGDVELDPLLSPNEVVGPPSGGNFPDWWDNPDFHKPAETIQKSSNLLGVQLFEVDVDMGETKPKFRIDCNGQSKPLVGSSIDSISASAAGQTVSVSLDLWFGMDPTDGCLYLGSDTGSFCFQDCGINLTAVTEADIENIIEDAVQSVVQSASDQFAQLGPLDTSDLVAAAVGLAVAAVVVLFAPEIIAVIGSILAAGTLA